MQIKWAALSIAALMVSSASAESEWSKYCGSLAAADSRAYASFWSAPDTTPGEWGMELCRIDRATNIEESCTRIYTARSHRAASAYWVGTCELVLAVQGVPGNSVFHWKGYRVNLVPREEARIPEDADFFELRFDQCRHSPPVMGP